MSSEEASKKTAGKRRRQPVTQILHKGAETTEANILILTIIIQAEDSKPNKHHKLERPLLEQQQ